MGQAESIDKIFSDAIREMEAAWKREQDAKAVAADATRTILDMRPDPSIPQPDPAMQSPCPPFASSFSDDSGCAPHPGDGEGMEESAASESGVPEGTAEAVSAEEGLASEVVEMDMEEKSGDLEEIHTDRIDPASEGGDSEGVEEMMEDARTRGEEDTFGEAESSGSREAFGMDASAVEPTAEDASSSEAEDAELFASTGDENLDHLIASVMTDAHLDEEEDESLSPGEEDSFSDMDSMLDEILSSDSEDAGVGMSEADLEVPEPVADLEEPMDPEADLAEMPMPAGIDAGEEREEDAVSVTPGDEFGDADSLLPEEDNAVETGTDYQEADSLEDAESLEGAESLGDADSLDDFLDKFGEDEDTEGDVPIIPVPVSEKSRQDALEQNLADEEEARNILHSIHNRIPPAQNASSSEGEKGLDAAMERCGTGSGSGIESALQECGLTNADLEEPLGEKKTELLAFLLKRHLRLLRRQLARMPEETLREEAVIRIRLSVDLDTESLQTSAEDETTFPLSDLPG